MKERLISITAAAISITLAVVVFLHITGVFTDKEMAKNHTLVSAGKDEYDVFFVGSSHIGIIQPALLWKEYGITSYNLCSRGDGMERYLAGLKLAFDYTKPKLVVIETDRYWAGEKFEKVPSYFHKTFDGFPLNPNKVRRVFDVCKDNEGRKELLYSFLRYHSRYNELTVSDFGKNNDAYIGASVSCEISPQDKQEIIPREQMPTGEIEDLSLRAIIEYCISQNVDVMLITMPHISAESNEQEKYNYARYLASLYGIKYLDFFHDDSLIDSVCDYRDKGHLNLSGGKKVGSVLGRFILDNYDIKDHRKDEQVCNKWNSLYSEYFNALNESIESTEEPLIIKNHRQALVLMTLDHYCGEIFIRNSENGYLSARGTKELIESIAGRKLESIYEAARDCQDYLLIYDRGSGLCQEYAGEDALAIMGEPDEPENVNITFRNAESEDKEFIGSYIEP